MALGHFCVFRVFGQFRWLLGFLRFFRVLGAFSFLN